MRILRSIGVPFIVFTVISILFVNKVAADGAFIHLDLKDNIWNLVDENSQQAIINYTGGTEKMIIGIDLSKEPSARSVWIFPVPANPNTIKINVVTRIPQLDGKDVYHDAKDGMHFINGALRATQIYPAIYDFFHNFSLLGIIAGSKGLGAGSALLGSDGNTYSKDTVRVYQQINNNGVTTEVISANSSTAIYNYLKDKQLDITAGSITQLDYYVGKGYSFVVSSASYYSQYYGLDQTDLNTQIMHVFNGNLSHYFAFSKFYPKLFKIIDSLTEKYPSFKNAEDPVAYLNSHTPESDTVYSMLYNQVSRDPTVAELVSDNILFDAPVQKTYGVSISFPTKQIYFPLKLTSAYGKTSTPITLRILGFVTPVVYKQIKQNTDVRYFNSGGFVNPLTESQDYFSNVKDGSIKYTRIIINGPSEQFVDDLWINNVAPVNLLFVNLIYNHNIFFILFLLLLISILASLISGTIVFGKYKISPIKLITLGLFNCLTIQTLAIYAFLIKIKKNSFGNQKPDEEPSLERRILYIFLFSFIYLIIVALLNYTVIQMYGGNDKRPDYDNYEQPSDNPTGVSI